jgi:translation initiation factor 2B subunit (eIF-2B alpha/beta/delta family)
MSTKVSKLDQLVELLKR